VERTSTRIGGAEGKAANKVKTKVTGWHKFKSHRKREPKGEGQDVAERGER